MNGNHHKTLRMIRSLTFIAVFVGLNTLALAKTRVSTSLRWGSDAESGAPFVFHDPTNYRKIIGYEVDIVAAIAQRLELQPQFVQNDWDSLIPGLNRGLYDIIVDGVAIRPEVAAEVAFSIPYNVSSLQLVVKSDQSVIDSIESCAGKVVGTLKNSEAHKYLSDMGTIGDIRIYEDEVNAYLDLENGRLDATLFDLPVALYYAQRKAGLKLVGAPIGRLEYAVVVAKNNPELVLKIDQALEAMKQDGTLRGILERWNLWTPTVAEYMQDFGPIVEGPTAWNAYLNAEDHDHSSWSVKLNRYKSFMPLLLKAAWTTIQISVISMALAIILGLLCGVGKVYGPAPVRWFVTFYVEIMRGTPLLIQLLFIFYALPNIGIRLSPFWAGIIGLALNYTAFEAENYRAGIISVPKGQMEAARALGMTRIQALKYVILPQAIKTVIPPVTNDFISLIKDSSLVSIITIVELTKTYTQLATTYYDFFGTGILVALVYLLLGLPFVRLAKWAEIRLATETKKVSHKFPSTRLTAGLFKSK